MVSIKHSIYIYRLIYDLWNRDSGPKVGSYSERILNLRKSSMLLYAPFVKFTANGRGIHAFIMGGGGGKYDHIMNKYVLGHTARHKCLSACPVPVK